MDTPVVGAIVQHVCLFVYQLIVIDTVPRGYMLSNGWIICITRCQRDPTGVMWSELFYSDDGGESWGFLSRVNDYGAPCSLVIMPDGRIVASPATASCLLAFARR